MNPWVILVGLVVLLWLWMSGRRRGGVPQGGVLSFGKSRAQKVENESVTFEDVAGVDEVLSELREIVDFLKNPERYARLGARIPKGVLLVGPPGTGKTLLARAVAGEAGVPFFQLSGSDFVEMFVGVGAARARDLFRKARDNAPSIIFIDELDALGRARGSGALAHEEREQTLNALLVEMDGFDPSTGVIVMAATNRPDVLDGALLRAGRFDRHIAVERPDLEGRRKILEIHVRGVQLAPGVDLVSIAGRTPGFAGADLANLINDAALLAARRSKEKVSQAEFDEAIERAMMGLEKKGRLLTPEERRLVAFHELGHAVIAEVVPGAEGVEKVTIVPRGVGLGVTWQRMTDDRYLLRQSELRDRIAVLLGGRAAEMFFVGEPSTGAQDDLHKATEMASDMVRKYGMSELGTRTFERARTAMVNADLVAASPREHGAAAADQIDREVQRLLAEGLERAQQILSEHEPAVRALAERLLDVQSLSGAEIRAALGLAEPGAAAPEAQGAEDGAETADPKPADSTSADSTSAGSTSGATG